MGASPTWTNQPRSGRRPSPFKNGKNGAPRIRSSGFLSWSCINPGQT
ncbi:Hypothetical protein AA314_02465 [Archangium gephyra]|uniref:Uncharacterized protein n=1 Tax=Archangium gephyra TaxID=48 RepID=A0AAC8Q4L0_9BACT|nr:Hypothetical protein AA314_02465 [Archangium gephyra]